MNLSGIYSLQVSRYLCYFFLTPREPCGMDRCQDPLNVFYFQAPLFSFSPQHGVFLNKFRQGLARGNFVQTLSGL